MSRAGLVETHTDTTDQSLQFDDPGVGDVHVDKPIGAIGTAAGGGDGRRGGKKRGVTMTYLHKLREILKDKVKPEDFAAAMRSARGHAGGVVKPSERANGQLVDESSNVTTGKLSMSASEYGMDMMMPIPTAPGGCDSCGCDGCNTAESCCDCDCDECGGDDEEDDDEMGVFEKADERIQYRPADKVGVQCGSCHYMHHDKCEIVEGIIDPAYVCNMFHEIVNRHSERDDAHAMAEPPVSEDGSHPPFTGTHSHGHNAMGAQGDDTQHDHSHTHDGDSAHDHSHAKAPVAAAESGGTPSTGGGKPEPQFVIGKLKDGSSTSVQTIVFNKDKFTLDEAKSWLKRNNMTASKVDENDSSFRFRQRDPSAFEPNSFRTISPGQKQASEFEYVEAIQAAEAVGCIDVADACVVCSVAASEDAGDNVLGGRRLEHKNGWAMFTELPAQAFVEPPEWMPYLPRPGVYTSPKYGEVRISLDRNRRFAQNFKNGLYQTQLPIDLEHETKLSGAAGWIRDMRENPDGSVDAKMEWTDRGDAALRSNRFKYFSPEFFDSWMDPIKTGEDGTNLVHKDIAIGGALTTRPFFKEKALRSLVMSEAGLAVKTFSDEEVFTDESDIIAPDQTVANGDTVEEVPGTPPVELSEDTQRRGNMADDKPTGAVIDQGTGGSKTAAELLQEKETELSALRAQIQASEAEAAASRQMAEAANGTSVALSERVAALEFDKRHKRFTDLVMGIGGEADGLRWFGEVESNVGVLETLADTLEDGEDNAKFKEHVERMKGLAGQVREAGLFSEKGTEAPKPEATTPWDKIVAWANESLANGRVKTFAEGIILAGTEHPEEYEQHSKNRKFGRED